MPHTEKPELQLVGEDGNIFNLLALAKKKFKELDKDEPDKGWNEKWLKFLDEVQTSKSYDEALMVFMKDFEVS
jgi:hypothetical protein